MKNRYEFNPALIKKKAVEWIEEWFRRHGEGCNAVVGISGGKDSAVVAALCSEALGKDRVIGVIMPNIMQPDIDDAWLLINHLGIKGMVVPVTAPVCDILKTMEMADVEPSAQAMINLPARVRMAALYAVSQSMNGRVANTSNLSENYVGYSTKYGDGAGDFAPISHLTCTEVVALGRELGLPEELMSKAPADGLCGKTDEESLGFTYEELDDYIRRGVTLSQETLEKIVALHEGNSFKLRLMPCYIPWWSDIYRHEEEYAAEKERNAE